MKKIKEIIEELKLLDVDLLTNSKFNEKIINVIIFGGSALHLLGIIDRPTKDIDAYVPNIEKELESDFLKIAKEYNIDFNGARRAGLFDKSHPDEFIEHDYNKNFNIINIKIPTYEFQVLLKLNAMRPQDIQDTFGNIDNWKSKLNIEKLYDLAIYLHPHINDGQESKSFLSNVKEFIEQLK